MQRNSMAGMLARRLCLTLTAIAVLAGAALSGSQEALPSSHTGRIGLVASGATWDRVAQCESGGRWSVSTGNGYHGGLQFSPSTWRGFGGKAFAPNAHQASRAEQIAVAERVLAKQGWNAWPVCSRKAGARGQSSAVKSAKSKAVKNRKHNDEGDDD